ncbi:MarR family winged helix-turn-helix transcriptional regulator [uncultured Jatrophihabitans sp.]|uniref:MarR family winged helix-turn-helix transcriptional regulator n=1 Tax=uncultured Jatrophihabitans sp. TaxID=1610747 RepID=UPI0035CA9966
MTVSTTDSPPAESAVRWLTDDEQSAWRAFLAMKTELDAQLGRDMQDSSGLSIADFSVLVPLSEHPEGRLRILELARGLQWEKSRLSHQLTRMEQRGLIERSNCREDRRGSFVVLTADGRRAVEAAAPRHVESVRRYLFDLLTPDQVAVLGDISRTVRDRLAAQCAGREATCAESDAGSC